MKNLKTEDVNAILFLGLENPMNPNEANDTLHGSLR
jgi:hypothetical protein